MAPQPQPTRDILLVTLHEREEQMQPGELPEGDDDWFKPRGRRRETLGKRLTWKITLGTSTDTTRGTTYTESVELETLAGDKAPFTGNKEEGALAAKMHTDGLDELSFWMD